MTFYTFGVLTGICVTLWWPVIRAWIAGPLMNWIKARLNR